MPHTESSAIKGEATATNVACWDSDGSTKIVTERLKKMFVEMGQKARIEKRQMPAEFAVFRKQHGIASGTFRVKKDISPGFKVGISLVIPTNVRSAFPAIPIPIPPTCTPPWHWD